MQISVQYIYDAPGASAWRSFGMPVTLIVIMKIQLLGVYAKNAIHNRTIEN